MITRFRRCTSPNIKTYKNHEILGACLHPTADVRLLDVLGEGSFGTVYSADYTTPDGKTLKIAVKRIETEYEYKSEINEKIDDVLYEVEYSYHMASQNIGPQVYDAFYIINKQRGMIITYILMEAFDGSSEKIYEESLSIKQYQDIHQQMIDLLHEQIYDNHMYCVDIKPGNYVVKKVGNDFVTRIIDFGKDWCYLDEFPGEYDTIDMFYFVILIQLCLMINTVITHEQISPIVLKPFFDDRVYKEAMKNKRYVKEILYRALFSINSPIHGRYFAYGIQVQEDT
jgi:serine/threonine protein kinase